MCVTCDDTKNARKMKHDQICVRESKKNSIKLVSECQKEYQMRVTYDDTKNGRKKMKQDQICVRESKRVSNWCQRVKQSVKCVSHVMTPKW